MAGPADEEAVSVVVRKNRTISTTGAATNVFVPR
jgi:hypothetical protein